MSPRELFRQNPEAVQKHLDLIDRSDVGSNLMVAFNEFCWSITKPDNAAEAAHNDGMREGARAVINVFLTLGSQPKSKPSTAVANLNNPDAYHRSRYARRPGPAQSSPGTGTNPNAGRTQAS